jgi:hypothetical protein
MGYGFCRRNGCVFFVRNVCTRGRYPSTCEFVVYRGVSLFCAECYHYSTCYRSRRERERCELWREFYEERRRALCREPDKTEGKVSSTG